MDHCIAAIVDESGDSETASTDKARVFGVQWRRIDECQRVFGGNGYMQKHPIARLHADARVQRICGGKSEIVSEIIARSL